jgi:hypothetical protein
LRAWENVVVSKMPPGDYTGTAIETLQTMSKEMKETAAKLGVK